MEGVAHGEGAAEEKREDISDLRAKMAYPLIKQTDMKEETRLEAVDAVVSAIEKYHEKYDLAAKAVKEVMDKKFAPNWHCVIGGGFGCEIICEKHSLLYMFFGGNLAILLWKL